jgi:hypothetical protein
MPRLLLADEPTSGLDAAAALRVVQQLKAIAVARDLPAAISLHQPRAGDNNNYYYTNDYYCYYYYD